MPDHVHVFLSAPHTIASCDVVKTLKSVSARCLFEKHPNLKSFYSRCGCMWGRGYFIASVGNISESTVRKYIENQKKGANYGKESKKEKKRNKKE